MKTKTGLTLVAALALALAPAACGKKSKDKKNNNKPTTGKTGDTGKTGNTGKAPASAPGVDMAGKTVTIGALNDESGPAKLVGKSFAIGKRLIAKVVNAGGSGILPEGWKVKLEEQDHQYNPQHSVSGYEKIKDKVLFIATSFGTRPTLPLQGKLQQDNMIAFPASLSSLMAKNENTPPLGPSYTVEAQRGLDYAVEQAKDPKKVKAAIVYQKDDYGKDALEGWKAQAAKHKVEVVSEQTVSADPKASVTGVITSLKKAGATHIFLATLPGVTAKVLGTAAKMKFMPMWLGATPAWIDLFFTGKLVPTAVFANFYWVQGLPYWGEDVPGMKKFLEAWDKHGKSMGNPDFYVLASYVQGLTQLHVFKKALEMKDVSRAGYKKALKTVKAYDGGGMFQPIDLSATPYKTSTKTRVLKPDFEKKTWAKVADYADPK